MDTPDSTTNFRLCRACGQCYPLTSEYWYRDKTAQHGLSYSCKICAKARVARWQIDHPERRVDNQRRYRERHGDRLRVESAEKRKLDPEHAYTTRKLWATANRKKVREASRKYSEKNPERAKEWARNNPFKAKAVKDRYRANKKMAEGSHTAAQLRDLFEDQCGRCAYCGIRIDDGYQIDHVIPLRQKGSDYIDNILLCCSTCNQSKGGRTFDEWKMVRGW
jgi:hypothetical protein